MSNLIVIYRNSAGDLSIQTDQATSQETENALNAFLEIENDFKNYPGEEDKRPSYKLLFPFKKQKNTISINSVTFKTNNNER